MNTFKYEVQQPGPESDRKLEFGIFMGGLNGYVPHMDETPTNYVGLPNEEFAHPVHTNKMVERYLRNLIEGERLGFDMICSMEQRCPAPFNSAMLMASYLIGRTHRVTVGAIGPVLNTYLNPLRLAEEIALLDMISGGRLSVGFPLGIGPGYHHMNINPTEARARFREGMELIKRAYTEPGPFEHRGEFYNLPIVNLYPRPMRMPDVWLPASGSLESIELAAANGFTYLAILNPIKVLAANAERFRQTARDKYGYDPSRKQVACMVLIYVAESDAQARKEAEPHILWYNQNLMRSMMHDFLPPGYSGLESVKRIFSGTGYRSKPPHETTYDESIAEFAAIVGSPDTVAARLKEMTDTLDAGRVLIMADCGSMPDWMINKSMTLFAHEVMPRFRPARSRPIWAHEVRAGFETETESAAMAPPPPRIPTATMPGVGHVDIRTAHVDELRKPYR